MKTSEIILKLANLGSRNDKVVVLKQAAGNEEFKSVMQFIYNPYCKTGISEAKLDKALSMSVNARPISYTEAIDYF